MSALQETACLRHTNHNQETHNLGVAIGIQPSSSYAAGKCSEKFDGYAGNVNAVEGYTKLPPSVKPNAN